MRELLSRRGFVGVMSVAAASVITAAGRGSAAKGCGEGLTRVRGKCVPMTPTPTPTNTATPTNTPTETMTPFPTDTPTITTTPFPTDTPTITNTPGPTNTPTSTPTETATPTQTATPDSGDWTDHGAIEPIASVPFTTCNYHNNGDWGHTISNLTMFQGQLFLGHGDYSCNVPNPIHLLAWDPDSGVVDYGTVNSVALLDMVNLGGMLALPFTDLAVGTYPSVGFLHTDGSLEIIGGGYTPRPWHVYGAAIFNGQRYVSGSYASPYGDGHSDPKAVWREDAPGDWIDLIPRTDTTGNEFAPNSYYGTNGRVYALFVMGDTLYAGMSDGVIRKTTDGENWTTATTGAPSRMRKPLAYGGSMYFMSGDAGYSLGSLSRFNGSSRSAVTSSVWDYTVGDDGKLYILKSDGKILDDKLATVGQAPERARSIAKMGGRFYIGTADSHLFSKAA